MNKFLELYVDAAAADPGFYPELRKIGETGIATVNTMELYYKPGSGFANSGKVEALLLKYGQGELRIIEGIPFLRLSGSYYDMGRQYGALLKDEFHKIYHELLPYKSAILANQPSDWHRQLEELTPEKYVQQIRGMSDGSVVPYDDLLLAAYFGVLERGGCSSILAKISDKNTPRLIHGRNLDYGKGTGRYPVVIDYQPAGEFEYLAIGTIASAGLVEGMNEKGITVSNNLAPGDPRNYAALLAQCAAGSTRPELQRARKFLEQRGRFSL